MRMWKSKKKLYENIIAYRAANPAATLEDIGGVFGLTRQRISQILREYNNNGNKVS